MWKKPKKVSLLRWNLMSKDYDWTGKDCPKFYVDREHWAGLLEKLGRGQITLPLH